MSERITQIVEAIRGLDASGFNNDGSPNVDALKEATGLTDITGDERNTAFAEYKSATPDAPEAVEPEAVEPEAVEPEAVEPEAVEPEAVEPEAVEPTGPVYVISEKVGGSLCSKGIHEVGKVVDERTFGAEKFASHLKNGYVVLKTAE